MNADSIKIECEEDGFWLVVEIDPDDSMNDHAGGYHFRIQDIDLDAFYDQVKGRIGPYLQEKEEARREYMKEGIAHDLARYGHVAGWREAEYHHEQDAEAYDVSDPKHPAFHSTHADIWDSREGK